MYYVFIRLINGREPFNKSLTNKSDWQVQNSKNKLKQKQ